MKLILENWRHFVEEANDLLGPELADKVAQSYGMKAASQAEKEILYHGEQMGLNLQRDVIPAAIKSRTKIDGEFLAAWITGRLNSIGGPDEEEAKKRYGKLFVKYKSMPTKFDNLPDKSTKKDKSSSRGKVTPKQAIKALESVAETNLTNLSANRANQIKSIIVTCIDSLKNSGM